MNRKVYDCFPFWKEFDILELRLNELHDVVDKFIIVESSYTHSGNKKPLYLQDNIHKFSKFRDQIILISDSHFKRKDSPTKREVHQRNLIGQGLKIVKAQKEDLIIISDCDEIPRASIIEYLSKNPLNCILQLDGYISYFNLYFQKWNRGRVLLYQDFKGAQKAHRDYFIQSAVEMRRFKALPFLKINPFFSVSWVDRILGMYVGFKSKPLPVIKNAGWHFTKMFPTETILESVYASSHTEFRSDVQGLNDIELKRSQNQTYYGSTLIGKVVELNDAFPKFLLNNKERFRDYIKTI